MRLERRLAAAGSPATAVALLGGLVLVVLAAPAAVPSSWVPSGMPRPGLEIVAGGAAGMGATVTVYRRRSLPGLNPVRASGRAASLVSVAPTLAATAGVVATLSTGASGEQESIGTALVAVSLLFGAVGGFVAAFVPAFVGGLVALVALGSTERVVAGEVHPLDRLRTWWRGEDEVTRSGVVGGAAVVLAGVWIGAVAAGLVGLGVATPRALAWPSVLGVLLVAVAAGAWRAARTHGGSGSDGHSARRLVSAITFVPTLATILLTVAGGLALLGWMAVTEGAAGLAAGIAFVVPVVGLLSSVGAVLVAVCVGAAVGVGVVLGSLSRRGDATG